MLSLASAISFNNMTPTLSYTFMHGFGCDASFWTHLTSSFSFPYTIWDRGYYGSVCTECIESTVRIGVGHSLGLIHLLESDIHFDIYIGLQAFIDFIGTYKERKTQLDIMKRQLHKDTMKTLYAFCTRSALPPPQEVVNITQLYSDYEKLYLTYYELIQDKQIYIYSTDDDDVVPYYLIQENFPSIPIYKAPHAKHALGYLQSEYTVKLLESFGHTLSRTL